MVVKCSTEKTKQNSIIPLVITQRQRQRKNRRRQRNHQSKQDKEDEAALALRMAQWTAQATKAKSWIQITERHGESEKTFRITSQRMAMFAKAEWDQFQALFQAKKDQKMQFYNTSYPKGADNFVTVTPNLGRKWQKMWRAAWAKVRAKLNVVEDLVGIKDVANISVPPAQMWVLNFVESLYTKEEDFLLDYDALHVWSYSTFRIDSEMKEGIKEGIIKHSEEKKSEEEDNKEEDEDSEEEVNSGEYSSEEEAKSDGDFKSPPSKIKPATNLEAFLRAPSKLMTKLPHHQTSGRTKGENRCCQCKSHTCSGNEDQSAKRQLFYD